ncbi:histidine phosphotransferase family protein [Pseudoroseicyclus tamaricis]|uniref:Histidine phosphotransferase n=1 Tax=Pseudoroseicyclus tamaricis TaxID=2705421 RepID=A0A6B2JR14_9RHOB|nr:histidine phosphotransferase family protein [Pseudoroseicyclus tamaricis]NDV00618.1 histidine phosphotransferase [Pseudoroseicyclus tamaricis]
MTGAVDLAALVGSRLCHDLISPLGAISNGVELISMSSRLDGPEMQLIGESVGAANARLRFFRIAFGDAAADAMIGPGEITSTLAAVSEGSRLSYSWAAEGEVRRREAKVIFLLLQCLETAMPFGGEVSVDRCETGRWRLQAEGRHMRIDPDLWQGLPEGQPPRDAQTPAMVQFVLLPSVMACYELSLDLQLCDDRIIARV